MSHHRFLWRCLGPAQAPAAVATLRGDMAAGGIAWDEVFRIADREMLSALLCSALAAKGLLDTVPEGIRGPLQRRLTINGVRNERIKQQASEIVAALNRTGIEPIILKGGLHLFESTPADLGARMMRDLDFVVPKDELDQAVECLSAIGYRPDLEGEKWTYHYRPLSRVGEFAPIDVHRYVGEQKDILPHGEAWREAVPVPAGDLRLRALCPTHRVFHNIFHSQVQDRGHELGIIYPRQLYALADMCTSHASAIDWDSLIRRMDGQGLGPQLCARMYQAARLFDVPLPRALSPTLGTRFHHRRCLVQLRRRWLMRLAHEWAGATQPFKRHAMDLIYGCGTNPIKVNAYRVRHAWYLLRKYRGRIWSKIAEKRVTYD
jgi:hypothetical protein